jgi:hypothetical protein
MPDDDAHWYPPVLALAAGAYTGSLSMPTSESTFVRYIGQFGDFSDNNALG